MSDVKRYEAVHLRYDDNNIRYGDGCEVEVVLATDYATLETENAKLRAELERRAVDGWKLVPVEPTESMMRVARGMTRQEEETIGCEYRKLVAAAPSAPKADDPVKVQLLEALEKMLTPAVRPLSGNTLSMSPVKMVAHIEAAIAAARQEGGKV